MFNVARGKFGECLERQFVEWERREGRRRTIEQFAVYLGFHRVTVTRWMNGQRVPEDKETIDALAEKLGDEIYDALDMPRPDPRLRGLIYIWGELPEGIKEEIRSIAEKNKGKSRGRKSKPAD